MATSPQTPPQGSIFGVPGFRAIWAAQFVSIFGDFLALFGIISLITFRLHGDAFQVTVVTVAYILPLAIFGPVAGVLVDHFNVKRTMIASDTIRGFLALLLLVVRDVHQIAAVLFAISMVSCLFMPAQSVTVRTLVPRERLLQANAMLAQAFYLIRIVSPLVAGALVAWLTERACFYIDAVSFFFSAIMISTLVVNRPPRADADKTIRGLTKDFLEGNRFIFTHPGLSFVFIAMAFAMFVLSSFSPLFSIFVRDQLRAGAFVYGMVSAMVGVGLLVCTTVIMKLKGSKAQPRIVLFGLLGLGISMALLALSQHASFASVSTFLMGFSVALVLIPAQTMSQQETPPEMVGRVSSTFMSMISIAQVLGLLLSGSLAQRLGIRPMFFACSATLAVITFAGWLWLSRQSHPSIDPTAA